MCWVCLIPHQSGISRSFLYIGNSILCVGVCVCVHVHESVHAWPPREGGLLYGSLENDLVLWLSQEGECSVVTLRGRLLCATSRGRLRYAISRGRLLYGHIERERLLFDYLIREILFYSHLKMENVLSHNGVCGAFCSLILLYKQDNHWIFFFFFYSTFSPICFCVNTTGDFVILCQLIMNKVCDSNSVNAFHYGEAKEG